MPPPVLPQIIFGVAALIGIGGQAGGAVAQCYNQGNCKRDVTYAGEPHPENILSRVNMHLPNRRQADVGPCNVPQYNYDLCKNDLQAVTIDTSIPSEGVARFENVPATCMNLATTLSGQCGGDAPGVQPCGSACLQYTGLTPEQMTTISQALQPGCDGQC
ncbi:hypothetical protein CERZMDRAFT_102205 [Cercospora zeae-maydis SCOH1-5]|uniref:Uncharacterized protein n=1 Tax=Cercospora zeae-maydis SCOH1-5 TaxID=717836 RepID=A0A6A6F3C3_9PEZI|nr:hypothetical protein CERZMDRAFT_102205 [Cercospora zeae-maydis SCOH1-5]